MNPLLNLLALIDLEHDIDLSLALRKAGRERRQAASRRGWQTRRCRGFGTGVPA